MSIQEEKDAQPTPKSNDSALASGETDSKSSGRTATRGAAVTRTWTGMLWNREVRLQIPNILTLLRFLAVPFFVVLMIDPTPQTSLWATIIFIFAAVTDWLDGYLARLFEAESILGKLLDPLADKILVMSALVMLAALPPGTGVPAWMAVVLLSREMLISGLRSVAALKGVVVAASPAAKHKTAWTFIAIVCLLINEPYNFGMLVDFHRAGLVFLAIALVLSIVSAVSYWRALRNVFV